uniref:hypothetical protein n=1 Tax=Bidens parviflora TaxID=1527830 RepID=UPI001FF446FA|nr:hypothetical protein MFQ53_mgp65 [Bidens parviflora]UIR98916.1 hypothetical protein [Bidens parviflora]
MDSFARCPAICCCWVESFLNPFRPGRIDCETYQEFILIAGWIIGSDVISLVSTIMARLEHEMILLAKKEGNEVTRPRRGEGFQLDCRSRWLCWKRLFSSRSTRVNQPNWNKEYE